MQVFKEFSSKYNKNRNIKKISESKIKELETEFDIYIPKDFKTFLLDFGALYTPTILDLITDNEEELNDVQQFWDIDEIIFDKKNEWTSKLTTDLIPFASDCMGNIFGFLTADLKVKSESSSVYFFDHDFDTVEIVSHSFSEWINKFNQM